MGRPIFINDDFLLANEIAKRLYHDFAKDLPIIDYHNHLSPKAIAENKKFETITEVWLNGDHYKWRAMRAHGIDERFITGEANDWEKFEKWAETVPYTIRNPLYHWTHLELMRYFNVDELLTKENSREIYEECNRQLNSNENRVLGLLKKMNVETVCTTDDPVDDLQYHKDFAEQNIGIQMRPAFRPDKAILIEQPHFVAYIDELSQVSGVEITDWPSLLTALEKRMDFFHSSGCRLSDHGLEQIQAVDFNEKEINEIFVKRLSNQNITGVAAAQFQTALLIFLGQAYHQRGWVQQFHLGALRNNNGRLLQQLGPDTGFDSIGDFSQARSLSRFLNQLDSTNQLTKTILYNLNPRDNEVFATMAGNFNDGSIPGKMQYGSAWWFLDQLDGMEKQINVLSNMGLLSRFIGMLTDSRSFLSFPRHEYFRRLLCTILGKDIEKGHLPNDIEFVGKVVRDICYFNAKSYFDF